MADSMVHQRGRSEDQVDLGVKKCNTVWELDKSDMPCFADAAQNAQLQSNTACCNSLVNGDKALLVKGVAAGNGWCDACSIAASSTSNRNVCLAIMIKLRYMQCKSTSPDKRFLSITTMLIPRELLGIRQFNTISQS